MLFPDVDHPWESKPLGEVFRLLLKGLNPREFPREEFHHYSIPAWDETGEPVIDLGEEIESGKLLLTEPGVLVSKLNPQIQRVRRFYPPNDGRRACASTEIMPFVPRSPDTSIAFYSHYFGSEQFRRNLVAAATGTTNSHQRVRPPQTLVWVIPSPLPGEQADIARILDAVDTALERTRAAVERAREVKRALVQRVLSEGLRGEPQRKTAIGLVPRSWHVVPVSSVVRNFQYGLSVPMDQKGKLPILRMGNIQNGELVLADLKYVSLPEKVVYPYLLKRGDVLFNRTNSQEWVGKVGIYRHDTPSVFASYLIRLVPDGAKVESYYLGHVLGSYSAQCRVKRYATPGVQQVNINASNLGKVLIPLPIGEDGLREQCGIAALLEAAKAVVRSYEPVLDAQQSLKASLIHDLLTGRVRVSNEAKAAAS